MKDFYYNWSIKKTCDTVTLESSHPLESYSWREMFFTYECKDDEIAYFKVDVNLIGLPDMSKLGIVLEIMSKRHDHCEKLNFQHYKVLLGMVGNNVESVKFIGRRDINMDTNMRALFKQNDLRTWTNLTYQRAVFKPYFNDAKELF